MAVTHQDVGILVDELQNLFQTPEETCQAPAETGTAGRNVDLIEAKYDSDHALT